MSFEFSSDFEYATPDELKDTYDAFESWLEVNGQPYLDEAALIYGAKEDQVPIIDWGPPSMRYVIHGDVLRQVIPNAAAALEVGDRLEIAYNLSYYIYNELGDHEYTGPACEIDINKNNQSLLKTGGFVIFAPDVADKTRNDEWTSVRDDIPKETPGPKSFSEHKVEKMTDHAFGIDGLTSDECRALREIAAKLDEIKVIQDVVAF